MASPALQTVQAAMGAIGQVVDALNVIPGAVGAAAGAFDQIVGAVRPFVAAFNPRAVENLDRAYQSLYATIGASLEPVIQIAARTVDRFAGAISGAMDRLRPVVEKVSMLFGSVMTPVLSAVSAAFGAAATVAEKLQPVFRLLGRALEAAAAQAATVAQVLAALVESGASPLVSTLGSLGKAGDYLQDAFVSLTVATLEATAHLLTMVGATDTLRKILKGISTPPPQAGRPAAPQGYQISGLEDVYRRRLLEGAKAMGGQSVEDKQLTAQERIAKACEGMLAKLDERKGADPFADTWGAFAADVASALPAQAARFFGRWTRRNEQRPAGEAP